MESSVGGFGEGKVVRDSWVGFGLAKERKKDDVVFLVGFLEERLDVLRLVITAG